MQGHDVWACSHSSMIWPSQVAWIPWVYLVRGHGPALSTCSSGSNASIAQSAAAPPQPPAPSCQISFDFQNFLSGEIGGSHGATATKAHQKQRASETAA